MLTKEVRQSPYIKQRIADKYQSLYDYEITYLTLLDVDNLISILKDYSYETYRIKDIFEELSDSKLNDLIYQCDNAWFYYSKKQRLSQIAKEIKRQRDIEKTENAKLENLKQINKSLVSCYSQNHITASNVKGLYREIKEEVVLSVEKLAIDIDGTSFEQIIKNAMELSRIINNPIVLGTDMLPKVDNFVGHFWETDNIEAYTFGVQKYSLAVIWSSLLLALYGQYTTIYSYERKNLIRGGIALALGTGVEFLQFCHKTPESPTYYIRMYSEAYCLIKNWYNEHHEKQIPDILDINIPQKEFAYLTYNEKITAGQILNMVYTFRVGDAFMTVLAKEGVLLAETFDKVIDTVWPTPNQQEVNKIYRLYTEDKIYKV